MALVVLGGCREPEQWSCSVAPSRYDVHADDKLDFLGGWEHVATIERSTDPAIVPGSETPPRLGAWEIHEDHLYLRDATHFLAFPIERHLTTGFDTDGYGCVADDPRPWFERRHMRVDWFTALAVEPAALPVDPDATVEALGWIGEEVLPFELERDDAGQLQVLRVRTEYLVTACADCEHAQIAVLHEMVRVAD